MAERLPRHLITVLWGGDPQAEEPRLYCAECGGGIYDGDIYHDLSCGPVCELCVDQYRRVAGERD